MIKYMIKSFLGFSLLLWSQGAYATNEGPYIGIDASYEVYNNSLTLPDGGETNVSIPVEPKGPAIGVFAGYRQNAGRFNMAVEARYGYGFTNDGTNQATLDLYGYDDYNFRINHSFGIALLPGFQITDDILIYTRIGYVASQVVEKYTQGPVLTTYKEYLDGFEYGAGFQVDLSSEMSIRAEYTRTSYKDFIYPDDSGVSIDRNKFFLGIMVGL